MLKKWIRLIICCIYFSSFLIGVTAHGAQTEDEPTFVSSTTQLKTKRVYSIVYDDSGSMTSGGKTDWARANYAFQIMSAFMNDEDEVYVTRMTSPRVSVPLEYFHYDRQISIDYFRSVINREGSTPLESIETAANQLALVEDKDPTVKHWLVIITDGGFKHEGAWISNTEQFKEYLDAYVDIELANGSEINVAYLAINDEAMKLYPDENNGLYTFDCKSGSIVESMVNVTTLITGNYLFNKDFVKVIDDNVVELELPIQVFDLTFLAQDAKNKLKKCYIKDTGQVLSTNVNVSVQHPKFEGRNTDKSLLGCVATVENSGNVLQPGVYRFEFEESLKKSKIEIYGTLALNLQLESKNSEGQYFVDLDKAYDTDILEAEAELFIYGSEDLADLSILHDDAEYQLTYYTNSDIANFSEEKDMSLKDLVLMSSLSNIEAKVKIGDFYNISAFIHGTPIKTFSYILKTQTEGDPIKKSALVGNRSQGVVFRVYDKDVQITEKDELRQIDLKFDMKDFAPLIYTYSEIRDDGTIICYPQFGINASVGSMIKWMSAWILTNGELTVRGYIELPFGGISEAFGTIMLEEDVRRTYYGYILIPVIILIIILGYAIKIRFRRTERLDYICLVKEEERYYSGLHKWVQTTLSVFDIFRGSYRAFLPFIRNKKTVEELTCYPSGRIFRIKDSIYLKRKDIPEGAQIIDLSLTDNILSDGVFITKENEAIKDIPEDKRITLNHKQGIIIWKENCAILYVYFRIKRNKRLKVMKNRSGLDV